MLVFVWFDVIGVVFFCCCFFGGRVFVFVWFFGCFCVVVFQGGGRVCWCSFLFGLLLLLFFGCFFVGFFFFGGVLVGVCF